MSPKVAIQLAVDINARKMKYADVDDEKGKFAKEHGKYLPIDRHFHIGEGDCNNQAEIVQGIIHNFRKENYKLTRVFPTSGNRFGGKKDIRHEYDSIIILKEKEIICTKIDPTFYNHPGGKLDATDFHVDKKMFKKEVYKDLEQYK